MNYTPITADTISKTAATLLRIIAKGPGQSRRCDRPLVRLIGDDLVSANLGGYAACFVVLTTKGRALAAELGFKVSELSAQTKDAMEAYQRKIRGY